MSVLTSVGTGSMSLLKSRTFWYIVIAIILLIIIWRYSDRAIEKAKSRLGRQTGDWQEGTITEGRKAQLENMATSLYNAIYGSPVTWNILFPYAGDVDARVAPMRAAAALNDNELLYLARYYEKELSDGNSLWYDVDEEAMPQSDVDENLQSRLASLGMK